MSVSFVGCPRDCYDTCRLRVVVEGGRLKSVAGADDEVTQGVTCPRAAKDVERVYSSLRVFYPAVNTGFGFRRVDWDSALELLTSRLLEVIERWGPEKVLFLEYAGNRGVLTRYASRRLWNYLGVTQTDGSICDANGDKALRLVYGSTYGVFPHEIENLSMVIAWGFNVAVSALHLWRRILGVKERGGIIYTVDVRLTETARLSNKFIKVRPGSDGYLALGIAKYLVDHDLVDRDFIERYTYGFNELVKHLENYSLDVVERVTGVPKEVIAEFAEDLANHKPFAILIGYGLQRRRSGGEIVRSIAIIPALLGIHRGFYYSNTDGLPINLAGVTGADRWRPKKVVSMERVAEEVYRGEYKFIYIHLHNPAATLPNSHKFIEGVKKDDVFVVVHETHWSDTARVADLVLPAPTFFEKLDAVFSYSHNVVYLNKPVIDPLGEALGEYQLMCEITKRIAREAYNEICLDPFEILRIAFGDEILEKLIEQGYAVLEPKPKDVYQTPTGRIEFYSTQAVKEGLPPLPTPPPGEEIGENEFILITSAHIKYIHTQFEEVYGGVPAELHISPEDAEKLGILDGDIVEVFNEKASFIARAVIDKGLQRGVLWMPRHARSINLLRVSTLMSDDVDAYGGATLNSTRVRIRKLKEMI